MADKTSPAAVDNVPIPMDGRHFTRFAASLGCNVKPYLSRRANNALAPGRLPSFTLAVKAVRMDSLDGGMPILSNLIMRSNPFDSRICRIFKVESDDLQPASTKYF